MKLPFENRRVAGQLLAGELQPSLSQAQPLVLALPRGGLPVADEVARVLGAPLDILLVRKLGVPWHKELAMGAIATGGARFLNDDLVRSLHVSEDEIRLIEMREREELQRRERVYRGDRPEQALAGRTVILVDDGLATGATMFAAVQAIRAQDPGRVVVAVPVAPPATVRALRGLADEVVCLAQPEPFKAVGAWYRDFAQVNDDEVRQILTDAWRKRSDADQVLSGRGS